MRNRGHGGLGKKGFSMYIRAMICSMFIDNMHTMYLNIHVHKHHCIYVITLELSLMCKYVVNNISLSFRYVQLCLLSCFEQFPSAEQLVSVHVFILKE